MNTPFNVVYASEIGCVLDCDLTTGAKIGGGTATDNTDTLNKILATASATNPIKLVLDGPTVVTGLVIPAAGYVWIDGIGSRSGIWVKSGSNSDAINNGKILPFNPSTTPPAQGGYVHLSNFQINGNRGDGTTGNSNSSNPRGITGTYWYTNIHLWNLTSVHIDNMYIFDSPAYSILLDNCSDITINNCKIVNPNVVAGFNNDCIHINGPASDVRVIGNYINNNFSDDAIALNAAEGYAGVIARATIVGNTFKNVYSALRAYGGVAVTASGSLDSVVFSNNVGNTSNDVMVLGGSATFGADNEGPRIFIASGNAFQCGGNYVVFGGNSGDFTLTDCVWNSPTAGGSWFSNQLAGTASSLTVNNCRVYRSTDGNNTSTPLLSSVGTACVVARLTINGFYIINEQGQSYSALANVLVMSNVAITRLFIESLDYTLISSLADSYTNISAISGNWQPETNITAIKTSAYTWLPTDRTILASTTGGSFSVTVPAKVYAGEKHTIKNTGTANTLTVAATVDGSPNPTLATLASMTILYDGSAWRKL